MAEFAELFPIGTRFKSQGRTITDGDFSLLTNSTWMMADIHSNRALMKNCAFGDIILPGPCVLAVVLGLANFSPFLAALEPAGVRFLALLGLENVSFRAPVLPGDTLTTYNEFIEVRPSVKNPKRAVLKFKDIGVNQKDEVVLECTRATLMELTE